VARSLSYSDAVKLLGGEGKTVAALDRLLGGALLAATGGGSALALALFDAKGELARLSGELLSGLLDRLSGLGRYDRTRRLEAAHTVIALTAYFEAVAEAGLPEFGFDRSEQVALAGGNQGDWLTGIVNFVGPPITPYVSREDSARVLELQYRNLSAQVRGFVLGLAIWERLDETQRARLERIFHDEVPERAVRRYEELLRRLAADFPEVAFWVNRAEHRATRAGLAELERVLAGIASGRVPDDRREALSRRYRAELDRGVMRTGDVPGGLSIPSLGEAYIDHRFRATSLGVVSAPDREDWWEHVEVRDDLYGYLLGHLTSPVAVRCPLLLLGQPGSGKSVLTKILAARLPASDFLVVRVVLRETPADTDLQGQIEYAVRDATGETLGWPALARTADGALPVVLLDGFDEFLQATGLSQSDYLEQIARFQEREADQGRPVVVLVTSRTAVADRVRIPAEGAVAIRLEPFDEGQVRRWLDVWNRANAGYFAGNGLRPLPAESVLAHPELTGQPLLLMMLALYDADGNDLRRDGDTLDRAELYERLLVRFAEREVAKSGARLDVREFRRAVEDDLLRLSVAAFAMFNRGRQWVTEDELSADLAALLDDRGAASGVQAALTPGQTIVGRFFFVHQAQAIRDERRLTTCEFLHATFGEYLVARLVARELAELARDAEHSARRTRRTATDDGFLYALLSYVPLSMRRPTVDFLVSRLRGDASVRALLLRLFTAAMDPREADRHADYAPERLPVPARYAAYAANLLLLAAAIGGEITGEELFPDAVNSVTGWRRHAMLWRSQLSNEGFFSLAETLTLRRLWRDERTRALTVTLDGAVDPTIDLRWTFNEQAPTRRSGFIGLDLGVESAFLCSMLGDTLTHALRPWRGLTDVIVFDEDGGPATSPAHLLTTLLNASADEAPPTELMRCYGACLAADMSPEGRYLRIVLRQLVLDAPRLPPEWIDSMLAYLEARLADLTLEPLIERMLAARRAAPLG
jgi:CheY-like chemotaxis protein